MGNVGGYRVGPPRVPGDDVDCLTAFAELRSPDLARATRILRIELRALDDLHHGTGAPTPALDWGSLSVEGPAVHTGPDRTSRFVYTGTVRRAADHPVTTS